MNAPDFSLYDQHGTTHTLADYAGKWLVLYFYPKDDTPGCTVEACSFRDEREVIARLGNAEVVGVSKDSVESHKAFAAKYGLDFTLLSDPDLSAIKAYNAWGKKMFGIEGVLRKTFIISPKGIIAKEYKRAIPKDHALKIIEDLRRLQA